MTDQLPTPAKAALDTADRHDTGTFLDLVTSDGFVDDWGRTFSARETIGLERRRVHRPGVTPVVTEVSTGADTAE